MRADKRDPVIAALRRFKPTKFFVTLRDGSSRELALSSRSNKWELLLDTINTMPWSRIEAMDAGNVVLGAVDQDTEEPEEEEDGTVTGEVMALTKIMLQVQQATMVECRRMFEARDKRDERTAQSMAEAVDVMKESFQLAIKMTALSASTQSGGGDDKPEPDAVMQMMQMAMAMKFGTPPPTLTPPRPKPAPAPAPSKAITKTPVDKPPGA